MADTVELRLDEKGIGAALSSPQAIARMGKEARARAQRATAAGAGFRTKRQYERGRQVRGGKAPAYGAKVKITPGGAVGIVHTANYAAMKWEHETNTLLKVR